MISDPKKIAVGIIAKLHPKAEAAPQTEHEESESSHKDELKMIMTDLIHAVHAGDEMAAADAFEAAFQCLEQAPHEEADHDLEEQEEME